MLFTSSLLVAALVGAAHAQTPKGFKPAAAKQLDVLFNGTAVKTPGEQLSKAQTAAQPQIALPNELSTTATANATFMFVMLDLDVPPQNGTQRRVLLHALNTGFKVTSQTVGGTAKLLASTAKGPATYIGPGPPATDTIAHRYVQLLFEQPATLKLSEADFSGMSGRINFDIEKFITTEKLKDPIAANFITVDGRAAAAAPSGTGGAKATGTGTRGKPTSTTEPFTGTAARSEKSLALAVVLGGLAVLAL